MFLTHRQHLFQPASFTPRLFHRSSLTFNLTSPFPVPQVSSPDCWFSSKAVLSVCPCYSNASLRTLAFRSNNVPLDLSQSSSSIVTSEKFKLGTKNEEMEDGRKRFWPAVSLIIGTAVGPGMLALPSATIKAGSIPSTFAIIFSWMYVISSIILVAELSFAAMEEDGVQEVSFTALASKTLGPSFGTFVAVVYVCLSFSLVIACVSGIGSLVSQQFSTMNPVLAHSLFPCFVGAVIGFFPFRVTDLTNRLLCALMLVSISALIAIGLSVGRGTMLGSLASSSWKVDAIMQAIPVTVLTLGFHVITPFVCKLLRHSVDEARKAIIFGGFVPLAMVLSWNVVVLGLAGRGTTGLQDPINLLLSVNPSALPAVQGFAFAALGTSLIGYAVSFPKQLVDTVRLVTTRVKMKMAGATEARSENLKLIADGQMESAFARDMGSSFDDCDSNKAQYIALRECAIVESGSDGDVEGSGCMKGYAPWDVAWNNIFVTWFILIVPICVSSFFQAAFAKALDFAGVYANSFLFGVLPPIMAWIHRTQKKYRSSACRKDLLPGGNLFLALLFCISIILWFFH
ncbi:hypothetical protein HPP92_019029 [Vanilla planifolia]|uniref:Tyrosine-specific transport protein n=1 Tax=Vanilla planifolia TaxID=51239 RepID=A0A835Q839_VANPL|nr:hypothetical protein HPP92_019029 [Vanilla planifolia]